MTKTKIILAVCCVSLLFTFACAAQIEDLPVKTVSFQIDDRTDYVNVMGDSIPRIPEFPDVPKKPGYVRGYVKDLTGEPMAGAKLGLKTAKLYDAYLAGSAETDANGFYEMKIPAGGARFDYAGVTIKLSRGIGALGLHPADGNLDESYAAATGGVENFVMLPYGIADREGVSRQANYRANYYGGSFKLIYYITPGGDIGGTSNMLATGSEIVVVLKPVSVLADGELFARAFEIRKKIEDSSIGELNVVNVPVGRYEIQVRQIDGKPLKMRQKSPTDSVFGISPAETSGSAQLIFNPLSADAKTATAARGSWTDLEIVVGRP